MSKYTRILTIIRNPLAVFLLLAAVSFRRADALVVAPIIAVSLLKLSVFFVAVISGPVIWIFHIIKKANRKKALFWALAAVFIMTSVVISVIHFSPGIKKQDMAEVPTGYEEQLKGVEKITPSEELEIQDVALPSIDKDGSMSPAIGGGPVPRGVQMLNPYTRTFSLIIKIFPFALCVTGVFYIAVNIKKKMWNALELILLCLMTGFVVSFTFAFYLVFGSTYRL